MRLKLNKGQIQLIQVAVRAAGIRDECGDGRYRMTLAQYRKPNGRPCTSSKDLDFDQMEDLLALCESMGFRMPGKTETYFRDKVAMRQVGDGNGASAAQLAGLRHLCGDLGWSDEQFRGMIARFTGGKCQTEMSLTRRQAWGLTEAMKAMFFRNKGIRFTGSLKDVETLVNSTETTHGTETDQVG